MYASCSTVDSYQESCWLKLLVNRCGESVNSSSSHTATIEDSAPAFNAGSRAKRTIGINIPAAINPPTPVSVYDKNCRLETLCSLSLTSKPPNSSKSTKFSLVSYRLIL